MLTPVDVQNKVFKGGIGYDKKDVENFMKALSSDYEMLYRSNVELNDKIAALNESLQHYKATEDSMQKAMTLSEKTAEETVIAAKDKARQLTTEAEKKAESVVADAQEELLETKKEILKLQQQHAKFKEQFTKILNSQLQLLNEEMVDIDLGAGFESQYYNESGFGSYAGEGGLGGLGGLGGGYVGSTPDGFERANQEPSFGRTSLNMDPFADAMNGGGRFSKQTGGSFIKNTKKTEEKAVKTEEKAVDTSVFEPQTEPSEKSSDKNDTYFGEVEDLVRETLDSEDNNSAGFDFVGDDNFVYSGEVEDNKSYLIGNEDDDEDEEGFTFL